MSIAPYVAAETMAAEADQEMAPGNGAAASTINRYCPVR